MLLQGAFKKDASDSKYYCKSSWVRILLLSVYHSYCCKMTLTNNGPLVLFGLYLSLHSSNLSIKKFNQILVDIKKAYMSYDQQMFNPSAGCAREEPLVSGQTMVPDSRMTASSQWDEYHGPERARIKSEFENNYRGGWVAQTWDTNQWIQVRGQGDC